MSSDPPIPTRRRREKDLEQSPCGMRQRILPMHPFPAIRVHNATRNQDTWDRPLSAVATLGQRHHILRGPRTSWPTDIGTGDFLERAVQALALGAKRPGAGEGRAASTRTCNGPG